MVAAWHYDGQTALRHGVTLSLNAGALHLLFEGGQSDVAPLDDLFWLEDRQGDRIFGSRSKEGWRIGVALPLPDELASLLPAPRTYGGLIDRVGLWQASIGFAVLSAVVIGFLVRVPDVVAPLIPLSWERRLGDALVGDLGNRICQTKEGEAALNALVRRLHPDTPQPRVRIANIDMVNAVTLPGGQILLFQGLLDDADSPDMVAGVLGHELGHVKHRDVMHALIRQLGLSVILGGLGGQQGDALSTLLSASYSQDAESRADRHALDILRKSRISPAATGSFFEMLAERSKTRLSGLTAYVASHPASDKRAVPFRIAAKSARDTAPALSPAQWRALRETCAQDPDISQQTTLF